MSHEPPVPPGNQSPYPIQEPPHVHKPTIAPPIAATKEPGKRGLVVGGALAALGLAAIGGLAALALTRKKPAPPKRRGRPRKKKAAS